MNYFIALFIDYVTRNASRTIFTDAISEIRNILNEKKADEVLKKRQQQLQRDVERAAKYYSEELSEQDN